MEEGTAVAAEVFTEAAVGVDFMEAEEGFTAAADSPAEATLVSAADIRLAGIVAEDIVAGMEAADTAAATTAAEATMADAADMVGADGVTVGVAEVGAIAATATEEAGAGDMASAGRIGDMAGDIRMATTATAGGITLPTVIMVTRRTGLQRTT